MKRKILLSPLLIVILIIVVGVGIAGASLFIGNTTGDSNSLGVNLQKGLVGWWKLDGNAKDATPYGRDGTVAGATLVNDRKGEALKAYSFNGSTDRISMGAFKIGGSDPDVVSFSAWIKDNDFGSTTNRRTIFSTTPSNTAGNWGVEVGAGSGGAGGIGRIVVIIPGVFEVETANSIIADSNWHHVVYIRRGSGATHEIYFDGVSIPLVTSLTNDFVDSTGEGKLIGERSTNNQVWSGSIDSVRLYNRALSTAEVAALYQEYDPGIQISDLQKGLVAHYKFNGNAKDDTPNANNGTVNGATLTTDRQGEMNSAYSFGTSKYITVNNSASLQSSQISSTMTVSAWVNGADNNTEETVVRKGNSFFMRLNPANEQPRFACFVINAGAAENRTATSTSSAWTNYVCTYDASVASNNLKLYKNATLVSQATKTGNIDMNGTVLSIGARSDGSAPYPGSIDDVRLYNRTLTQTEITALYQEYDPGIQVSNLQKGLVGQWSLDGDVKDRTPYGNNGTVHGPVPIADRKGETNRAYNFGGGTDYIDLGNPSIFPSGTSARTMCAWAETNSTTAAFRWITAYGSAVTSEAMFLGMTGTTLYGGAYADDLTVSNFWATGVWHHICLTYDGTNAILYADGAVVAGPTAKTWNLVKNVSYIGRKVNNAEYWNGSVDDVRIYNRALTATEVKALYESY